MSKKPADRLLTPEVVADRLSVSLRTLWRMVARGQFPQPLRYNRKLVRFRESDVSAWIVGPDGSPPEAMPETEPADDPPPVAPERPARKHALKLPACKPSEACELRGGLAHLDRLAERAALSLPLFE